MCEGEEDDGEGGDVAAISVLVAIAARDMTGDVTITAVEYWLQMSYQPQKDPGNEMRPVLG